MLKAPELSALLDIECWLFPCDGANWHSRQEFRLQPPRSKRGALYIELRERESFPRRKNERADGQLATIARQASQLFFSLASSSMRGCSHCCSSGVARGNWWVATVLPRALRFKRPLHRCNAYNPKMNRDAKAELNHRSQACEVLAGTGISRRENSCVVNSAGIQLLLPPCVNSYTSTQLRFSFC